MNPIKNMIENLEAGNFKVIITDDGQPRDVTQDNIEALIRVLETAYEKDAYIAELNAAMSLALRYLEHPDVLAITKDMALSGEAVNNRIRNTLLDKYK